MATKPTTKNISATSREIVNSIISGTGMNVPLIGKDGATYREVGDIICNDSVLTNIFLSTLFNRIGKVIVTSKLYNNPWVRFKKGLLENGEIVEELYVDLVLGKITKWNDTSDENPFARTIPDVKSAFHPINIKSYYPTTVTLTELKTAFLSSSGVVDLVGKIVNAMYTSANLDEFMLMKYVLAKAILNGNVRGVEIPSFTTLQDMKDIVSTVKSTANKFAFMSKNYNAMQVHNYTDLSDQHIIVQADFDATMSVEVLATAFNMDKADFMGNRNLIDSFGEIDNERLGAIVENYVPLTTAELSVLSTIPCVLIDKDFFQIYDVEMKFTEQYNARKDYWNYFLHVWKIASFSPFMNASVFVTGEPTITSINVNPTAMTITNGQKGIVDVVVETTNFAPKTVTWTSSDETIAIVNQEGVVTTLKTGEVDIVATSTFNQMMSATCAATVV